MTDVLQRIVDNKRREVEAYERHLLAAPSMLPSAPRPSMRQALQQSPTGIIAEFKRRSPSKGDIHPMAMVSSVVPAYEAAGAAACSVLTDTPFFGGALSDLAVARSVSSLPLLRKDFIVTEAQIAMAAACGASAILLIAAALTRHEIESFAAAAHARGLEVLLELHSLSECDKLTDMADMVGINNRDLTTFHTDPSLSLKMAGIIPDSFLKVAESGLTDMQEVRRLRRAGYRGFLIGETFMKHADPGEALSRFLSDSL